MIFCLRNAAKKLVIAPFPAIKFKVYLFLLQKALFMIKQYVWKKIGLIFSFSFFPARLSFSPLQIFYTSSFRIFCIEQINLKNIEKSFNLAGLVYITLKLHSLKIFQWTVLIIPTKFPTPKTLNYRVFHSPIKTNFIYHLSFYCLQIRCACLLHLFRPIRNWSMSHRWLFRWWKTPPNTSGQLGTRKRQLMLHFG